MSSVLSIWVTMSESMGLWAEGSCSHLCPHMHSWPLHPALPPVVLGLPLLILTLASSGGLGLLCLGVSASRCAFSWVCGLLSEGGGLCRR